MSSTQFIASRPHQIAPTTTPKQAPGTHGFIDYREIPGGGASFVPQLEQLRTGASLVQG